MLVLSRRTDQEIRFPSLDIKVRVLKAAGTVKLGIDAPSDIRICRDEIEQKLENNLPSKDEIARLPKKARHEIRNQMQSITLGVHLLGEQFAQQRFEEAQKTMDQLLGLAENISSHRSVESPVKKPANTRTRVLVVEDEPNEREMLAGLLEMNGYAVTTAAGGIDAIDQLKKQPPPAFILLDLNLPDIGGDQVIDWIRNSNRMKSTSIFVTSGADKPEDHSPLDQWFQKPIDPRGLMKAMRQNLLTAS